jgi:hypothetical protein
MAKREIRFFNTTGPCNPDMHYMLPPEDRLVGAQLHRYIKDQLYWVLHAPRQTGKTTFLQSYLRQINSGNDAIAYYVSLERCKGVQEEEKGIPMICEAIKDFANNSGLPISNFDTKFHPFMIYNVLSDLSELVAPKPLVILFDDIDALEGKTLLSFLSEIRSSFSLRGVGKFPVSILFAGLRNIRNYGRGLDYHTVPFNIIEDVVLLQNFNVENISELNVENISELFAQYTQETRQQITQDALNYIYGQSKGQPCIVNSLLERATSISGTIEKRHIETICEQMELAHETHLDKLGIGLDDPRISNVIKTLMTGELDLDLIESEEFEYCMDLGLVSRQRTMPMVANPIYKKVFARDKAFNND